MLEYLLELKGVATPGGTQRALRRAARAGEPHFAAKRKVKGYSGGMRQRLGIAQAIAGDPRLIIVDEPTAGLDPEERLRFYRLLAELAGRPTVLLSTHIVEDVAVLCPRFAVIRNGQVVAETTPAEARRLLAGTIFEGAVAPVSSTSLQAAKRRHAGVARRGAEPRAHLRAEREAPPGFEPAVADARGRVLRADARQA